MFLMILILTKISLTLSCNSDFTGTGYSCDPGGVNPDCCVYDSNYCWLGGRTCDVGFIDTYYVKYECCTPNNFGNHFMLCRSTAGNCCPFPRTCSTAAPTALITMNPTLAPSQQPTPQSTTNQSAGVPTQSPTDGEELHFVYSDPDQQIQITDECPFPNLANQEIDCAEPSGVVSKSHCTKSVEWYLCAMNGIRPFCDRIWEDRKPIIKSRLSFLMQGCYGLFTPSDYNLLILNLIEIKTPVVVVGDPHIYTPIGIILCKDVGLIKIMDSFGISLYMEVTDNTTYAVNRFIVRNETINTTEVQIFSRFRNNISLTSLNISVTDMGLMLESRIPYINYCKNYVNESGWEAARDYDYSKTKNTISNSIHQRAIKYMSQLSSSSSCESKITNTWCAILIVITILSR